IGNPIAAILGMHDLLADGDLPDTEQRDFLARMRRETERISGVLRDLLDFSRPEEPHSSSSMVAAAIDVREAISDVASLVRTPKEFKAVTLETKLPENPVFAAMAAPRLTQVLLNLVLNAGAAVKDSAEKRVVVRARAEGPRVRIEVEDGGPGVPADM